MPVLMVSSVSMGRVQNLYQKKFATSSTKCRDTEINICKISRQIREAAWFKCFYKKQDRISYHPEISIWGGRSGIHCKIDIMNILRKIRMIGIGYRKVLKGNKRVPVVYDTTMFSVNPPCIGMYPTWGNPPRQ